jgi:hypothetical protein
VPLEAVVLGALALRVSSAWLAGAGRPRWRRALDLGHAAAGVIAVGVALAAVAALGGTTDLGGLQEQQGAAPWTWTLLRTPLGPLALGLVVLGGGTAPATVARGTGAQARVARALDDLVLVAFAAATATVLLGGWGPDDLRGAGRAAFALLHVALATLLWSWMRRGRRLGRPTRAGVAAALGLVVVVAVGTALRISWEPPPELERGLARVIGATAALLGVTAVARLLAGRVRSASEPAHPFL